MDEALIVRTSQAVSQLLRDLDQITNRQPTPFHNDFV